MSRRKRWRPSRAVRNFMALHSLYWRRTKGGSDYDDFDVEVYRVVGGDAFTRYEQRIAHLMLGIRDEDHPCWTDERIMDEIKWGLDENSAED